ncbi:MAG: GDP-mannose 4,6-dehydratase [Candidatus Omnitrophota bacterium]|nr:GDP-mannose 4,6-dehydratase [Candidatus Omnitrophota bacterium]
MGKETVAVIGSNCFTGSHVVDRLLQDKDLRGIGLSRSPEKKDFFLPYKSRAEADFQFFQVDLNRQSEELIRILDEFEPSTVINVAALSEVALSNFQPMDYFDTNTMGVVKLCSQLRERSYLKRYVHISSAEVYGSCPEPLLESAPLNPSTPYAVSKAAGDMYLQTLYKNFDFPMMLIRSTNVYGRHQQLFKIIPRTIIYLKQGKTLELHGGGMAVKTWLHIRDVSEGIYQAMKKGKPGEIYHFADAHSYTIRDLVERICRLMGKDFSACTKDVGERLGQDARYELDYGKAKRELGWQPRVSFEEGLRETIEWLENDPNEIEGESLVYVHQA